MGFKTNDPNEVYYNEISDEELEANARIFSGLSPGRYSFQDGSWKKIGAAGSSEEDTSLSQEQAIFLKQQLETEFKIRL